MKFGRLTLDMFRKLLSNCKKRFLLGRAHVERILVLIIKRKNNFRAIKNNYYVEVVALVYQDITQRLATQTLYLYISRLKGDY